MVVKKEGHALPSLKPPLGPFDAEGGDVVLKGQRIVDAKRFDKASDKNDPIKQNREGKPRHRSHVDQPPHAVGKFSGSPKSPLPAIVV